jgi:hypothetical protein
VAGATGGSASIAARSASIRSAGAHPSARLVRVFAIGRLSVEIGRRGKGAARQKRALEVIVRAFDESLGLRLSG